MKTPAKLEVICVRCGDVHDFAEGQVEIATTADLRQLLERRAEIHGWQTLRGDTNGKRNGRCPRHAIRLEGGTA